MRSHRQPLERRKQLVDDRISKATEERGVLLVHTGNGKGKSTAAFGMVMRALGHGMRVGIVQFIKGPKATGEELFLQRFPTVSFYAMGEGFTWETQDSERDTQVAQRAWSKAVSLLSDSRVDLVLLDELNIALKLKYLDMQEVLARLAVRPNHQHVIVTGRGAPQALMDQADTVTEMRMIKHAFVAGIKAQKGIEL